MAGSVSGAPATQARLALSQSAARPGETVLAGVHLRMNSRWHTYWKNNGDAGIPTKIEWTLPAGVTAGEIQWPLPGKFQETELTTYAYTNEVVLVVPLTIAADS